MFWSILRPQTAQLFIVSVSLVSRRSQYVNLCWKFSNFQVQRSQTLWDFSYNANKSLWLARRRVRLKPHWWSTIQVTKKCSKETSVTFSIGKSLSEALILGSTNPQYDKRFFIDLPAQYMKTTSSEHVVYINCFFVFVLTFKTIYVHVLSL